MYFAMSVSYRPRGHEAFGRYDERTRPRIIEPPSGPSSVQPPFRLACHDDERDRARWTPQRPDKGRVG